MSCTMRPLWSTLPFWAKKSSTGISYSFFATRLGLVGAGGLDRLEVLGHGRVGAGLDHVRHAAGALLEALGEGAGLVVEIPVVAFRQHEPLRRLQSEAVDLGQREEQR